MLTRFITLLCASAALLSLPSCQTMAGMGKDVQNLGKSVENTANTGIRYAQKKTNPQPEPLPNY